MKKKTFVLVVLCSMLLFVFSSCDDDDDPVPYNVLEAINDPAFRMMAQYYTLNDHEAYTEHEEFAAFAAWDTNGDGVLSVEEAAAVTAMGVSNGYLGTSIASLSGIEYFTGLRILACAKNELTELDLSKNTELRVLICSNNQLTKLDLSKNTQLAFLDCHANQLAELDLSKNTELSRLLCYNNGLAALDASAMAFFGEQSYRLYCGNQTINDRPEQEIMLTLRENQQAFWNKILKNSNYNINVTVVTE